MGNFTKKKLLNLAFKQSIRITSSYLNLIVPDDIFRINEQLLLKLSMTAIEKHRIRDHEQVQLAVNVPVPDSIRANTVLFRRLLQEIYYETLRGSSQSSQQQLCLRIDQLIMSSYVTAGSQRKGQPSADACAVNSTSAVLTHVQLTHALCCRNFVVVL